MEEMPIDFIHQGKEMNGLMGFQSGLQKVLILRRVILILNEGGMGGKGCVLRSEVRGQEAC